MKLCLSEDQVTISFQHREVLKVCSHTECHLDPAWLANACLVNTDFSSDSASRAPERGLKLQSWTWCFLWDGQRSLLKKTKNAGLTTGDCSGDEKWTTKRTFFMRPRNESSLSPLFIQELCCFKGLFLFRMRNHLASEAHRAIGSTLGYWFPWRSTALHKGPQRPQREGAGVTNA